MTDRICELEQRRDTAYKAADAAYQAEREAADSEYERQRNDSESVRLATHTAINRRCLEKGDWTRAAERVARAQADEAHKARLQQIDEAYKALCAAIRARYDAAVDAAETKFGRLYDEHCAAEDRMRQAAEREHEREQRTAAERERQRVALQRVADRKATRRMIEENAPPVMTVTPRQAAARIGLTMTQFWALVRSGKYPAPNDSNVYDADTVARLPRPKIRVQRITPNNIYTQIWRF